MLHQFNGTDGDELNDALVLATDGNFYGNTTYGGAHGNGNVFRITPAGAFTDLYDLDNQQGDGGFPSAGWYKAATEISMERQSMAGRTAMESYLKSRQLVITPFCTT